MTLDNIDTILKNYKANLGRCHHLEVEINAVERKIEAVKNDTVDTLASPKPRVLSDMPRGTQISNPTEKLGAMLADGYKTDEQIGLESKLAELNAEYDSRITDVEYVDAWMSGLTERENTIITTHVIDGLSWRDTAIIYKQKHGEDVSKDTLKRIKDKAIDKIVEMAK